MTRWKTSQFMTAVAFIGLVACGGGEPDVEDTGMDDTPEVPVTPAPDATADGAGAPAELPEGVTADMVAAGQQVFSGTCAACHGPNAMGTPLAPNLTDDTWLNISGRDYNEIVEIVKTGVATPVEAPAAMPPMGGASLTDEQVNNVAAYVVSLGGS